MRPLANSFLSALPDPEWLAIRPFVTRGPLELGQRLHWANERVEHVFFPHSSVVKLTTPLNSNGPVSALIGKNGVVGSYDLAELIEAPCYATVCIPGEAARISALNYCNVLKARPVLRRLAARQQNALLKQTMVTASCNARHDVRARLCRLLYELQERSGNEGLMHFTQAAMADMLGVQRTTLGIAIGQLETEGIVSARRGSFEVVGKEALERGCCECATTMKNALTALNLEAASEREIAAGR
jgi:CRP-like cAMP-binding protein